MTIFGEREEAWQSTANGIEREQTLSNVTAKAEYGVDWDFIVKGIEAQRLEYREGVIWGNPYLKILRSQLEKYMAQELGEDYLVKVKAQTELRRTKKEIAELQRRLNELRRRGNDLEALLAK